MQAPMAACRAFTSQRVPVPLSPSVRISQEHAVFTGRCGCSDHCDRRSNHGWVSGTQLVLSQCKQRMMSIYMACMYACRREACTRNDHPPRTHAGLRCMTRMHGCTWPLHMPHYYWIMLHATPSRPAHGRISTRGWASSLLIIHHRLIRQARHGRISTRAISVGDLQLDMPEIDGDIRSLQVEMGAIFDVGQQMLHRDALAIRPAL